MPKSTSCIVPQRGHRNADGYIRVLDKPRSEGGRLVMLHRVEWEKSNPPVPKGHNINHKCKNRECQNVNHMEMLTLSAHASKDNAQRYKAREDQVVAHLMKMGDTELTTAKLFGITQAAVHKIKHRRIN